MSGASRARRYRERKAREGLVSVQVWVTREARDKLDRERQGSRDEWIERLIREH